MLKTTMPRFHVFGVIKPAFSYLLKTTRSLAQNSGQIPEI